MKKGFSEILLVLGVASAITGGAFWVQATASSEVAPVSEKTDSNEKRIVELEKSDALKNQEIRQVSEKLDLVINALGLKYVPSTSINHE